MNKMDYREHDLNEFVTIADEHGEVTTGRETLTMSEEERHATIESLPTFTSARKIKDMD